jgi:hypothetical protein
LRGQRFHLRSQRRSVASSGAPDTKCCSRPTKIH